MTKEELHEQIRVLLREPLKETVSGTWLYTDEDLVLYVRSALRSLVAKGVVTDAVMAADGTLSPEPSNRVGLLIAYHAASALLRGDMIQKLNTGEIGVAFRAGADSLDTKTVATTMKAIANAYDDDLTTLLTIELTDPDSAGQGVFGDSTLSM